MSSKQILVHKTYVTEPKSSSNQIEFITFDLTDVKLGTFIVAIQSFLPEEHLAMIKEIIRDAINDFTTIARQITAVDHLEKIFTYVNRHTASILSTGDYRNIHVGLIYIKDDEMHFSLNGDFKLMLVRKNRVFDVIRMTYGLSPRSFDKFFSRMYSGALTENDNLIITTNESWDCFDTQKIPEIINKLPIHGAVEMLKSYLPENTTYRLGFMLAGIANTEQPADDRIIDQNLTPSESIKVLIDTEETTSAWLSPSPLQSLQKISSGAKSAINKLSKGTQPSKQVLTTASTFGVQILTAIKKTPNLIQTLVPKKSALPQAVSSAMTGTNVVTKRPKKARNTAPKKSIMTQLKAIPKSILYQLDRLKKQYNRWPRNTKLLLVTALIMIVLFWQSVSLMNQRNQQQELNTYFNDQATEIENIQTQADQAMIFKDFARARSLLSESTNAIAALPTTTDQQATIKEELESINQEALQKANRLTVIPSPLALADISTSFKATPAHLAVGGNTIFAVSNNQMTAINPGSGEFVSLDLPNNIQNINHAISEDASDPDANIILFHDNTQITSLDTTSAEFTAINTSLPSNTSATPGLTIFNNRLYRIDRNNNQIVRHLRSGGSFQAGSNWLNAPFDLSNATALAIDGVIYVLDGNEGLVQFNQGEKTSWNFESIDPSLTQATKLYTTTDSNALYVLDPAYQRFLLFTKDGDFVQQFSSPEFNALTDMVVIEQGNQVTVYLLNGSTIYVVQFTVQ